MEYKKAKPAAVPDQLEICVNLWWFVDIDSGLVLRVAGRGYAMSGDDESKLKTLHLLATTDFHIAETYKIPDRFVLILEDEKIRGVIPVSIIHEHMEIFESVYKGIEEMLPKQIRSVGGEYESYKLTVPKDPLCVLTCVVEGSDGSLMPMVSKSPQINSR